MPLPIYLIGSTTKKSFRAFPYTHKKNHNLKICVHKLKKEVAIDFIPEILH